MRKIISIFCLCSFVGYFSVLSPAQAQSRVSPSFDKEVHANINVSIEALRNTINTNYNKTEKAIAWMSIIYKGIKGDKTIGLYDETEKFYTWLFTNGNSELIHHSLNTINREFRHLPSSAALEISAKHLSQNKMKLTRVDQFMATYLLGYDFASFLQFDRQNDLFLSQLDFINRLETTDRNLYLHQGAAFYGYGEVLMRKKRITEALEYFFKAENHYLKGPNSTHNLYTVHLYIARAFLAHKDYERSAFYVQKSILEWPEDRIDSKVNLYTVLAAAQLGYEGPSTALETLKLGEEQIINPREDYKIYFLEVYMEVLASLKKYSKALDKGAKATSLAQKLQNKEIENRLKFKIGDIYSKMGDPVKAEKMILSALKELDEISPNSYPDVYEVLANLYTIQGRLKEALEANKKKIAAEKHQLDLINHDILADLDSVNDLRKAQNQKEHNPLISIQETNKGLEKKRKLSTTDMYFFTFLIFVIGLVYLVYRKRMRN